MITYLRFKKCDVCLFVLDSRANKECIERRHKRRLWRHLGQNIYLCRMECHDDPGTLTIPSRVYCLETIISIQMDQPDFPNPRPSRTVVCDFSDTAMYKYNIREPKQQMK